MDSNGRYVAAPKGTPARKVARWRAQGTVRDLTGQTVSLQRVAATKVEAERKLTQALRERVAQVQGEELRPASSVAEAAQVWLRDAERAGKLTTSSLRVYRLAVDRHIVGTAASPGQLAALRLREVTPPRVERALQHVADSAGDGMAKTVRTVLRNVFAFAVYQAAMPGNPVPDARPVKATTARAERARDTDRAFTADELEHVLALAQTDPQAVNRDLGDLCLFLDGLGLRLGEALAVTWADLDLESDAPTARAGHQTVSRIPGEGLRITQHGATKYHARTLPLTGSLAAVLRARRERLEGLDNPHNVVFVNVRGGSLRDPSNTQHQLRDLLNAAGCPWASSHTFRRTVATRLRDAGHPERLVSDYLGHAKVSTTQDNYYARSSTVAREAASTMERPRLRVVS